MGQLGKKLLYLFGGIFIIFVGAAVILPPMLIGKYKDQIITIAREQTGRDVQIEDISARLLPNAQVTLKNVVVPSVEGSSSKNLVTAQSFHVKVDLLPLLTKTIKVNLIELKDSKIHGEILPDGSNNWTMAFMEAQPESAAGRQNAAQNADNNKNSMTVKLDKVQISNGHILFVNRKPGKNVGLLQELKNVNLQASAKNLTQGPYALDGNFIWNDLPFDIDMKAGDLSAEKAAINMDVKIEKQHGVKFDGNLAFAPDFVFSSIAGQAELNSQNPAQLMQVLLGDTMGLPNIPIQMSAQLEAGEKSGKIDKGKISIGKSQMDFQSLWELGDIISANVKIRGKTINLDEVLTALAPQAKQPENQPMPATTSENKTQAKPSIFRLPENVNANADVQIQNITYNKENVSNIILQAKLEGGILQVPQVSAVLPGSSPIGANMVVKNSETTPYVDGNFSFKSPALKNLITWLGGDVSAIPQTRLNQLNFRSNISGNLDNVSLSNLEGQIDDMHVQGSLGAKLQGRMAVLTDLSIDKLDLNPWLTAFAAKNETKTSYRLNTDAIFPQAYAENVASQLVPIDADIKFYIGKLIYENIVASEVQTNFTVKNDNLNILHATIGNIEGAKINASGQIHNLGGNQNATDLTVALNANSIAKLLQIANVKDIPADKIGAVSAKAVMNGSLKGLVSLNASAKALGGTYNTAGQINMAELKSGNMKLNQLYFEIKHSNLNQVTAVFAPETKIPNGLSAVDVKGNANIDGKVYKISKFSGSIGQSHIQSAQVTADLSGAKPNIQTNLKASMINLDALNDGGAKANAQKAQAAKRKPGTPPWSDDKIDLSALNSLNLNADIAADKMKISGKNLANVKLKATIKNGLLDISTLSAAAYGGSLSANAKVNGNQTPKIDASFQINSLNLNQLSKDMAGIKLPIGRLNTQASINMSGASSRQMVSSLGGKGTLNIAGLGAQQSGSEFDAFLAVLQKLASLKKEGILDVSSAFSINKGIVNLSSMQISGPIGGNAKGNINLPQWTLDIAGAFTFLDGGASKLILGALGKQNLTENHDFRVYGSIDNPQMDLPSDLQKALNVYKAANEKDIKSLISNGVSADLLKKLGVSSADTDVINELINSFGGNNNKPSKPAASGANNNTAAPSNPNPVSKATDQAVDKILGEDNPLGDAAKGIVNEEAGKLFKKLF